MRAYIRPAQDLPGNQTDLTFSRNVTDPEIESTVQVNFQNIANEANPLFWTVYILGLYQETEARDSDPDHSLALYGVTSNVESTMFLELARPTEYEDLDRVRPLGVAPWRDRSIGGKFTTAHEIGHLFGCDHFDGQGSTTDFGVMGLSATRTSSTFNDYSIKIIRTALNP